MKRKRIKVTGYIETPWLPPQLLNEDDPTGLSEQGKRLMVIGGPHQLQVSSLNDLTFEQEEVEEG